MLSKEEYLNLVDILAGEDKFDEYVWGFVYPGDNLTPYDVEKARDYIVENLKKLIEEHFDNPPLKFEELKEGMWVWDNKMKEYIFIFKPLNWEPIKGIRYAHQIINHSTYGYYMDFEENRFYRREVRYDGK